MNIEDDGSLEWLKIPADQTNRHFNCPETTQQKLCSWLGWAKYSDSENLTKKIIKKEEYGNCFL